MGVLFPSQPWADSLKKVLNEDKPFEEHGKTWGVEFKGDFLFEIQAGAGLEKTTYLYLNLKDGKVLDSIIYEDKPELDTGYVVSASYANWKPPVKGQKDFIECIIRGQLKLDGDMGRFMRYAKFARALADALDKVDAEYLGE